ncbi:MAG: AAA family ATPase [Anaerolineae bacterium]|nr:AAA family ATPase [Anaerolineae bacterium]
MTTGTIIFLNGTSSSGKSTIAQALQQMMGIPAMHVQVDTFAQMLPEGFLENAEPALRKQTAARLISGFHQAVAALAAAGNTIILDHVVPSPKWWEECMTLFAPFHLITVGVHCPLEELERREEARGDRHPGLARMQFEPVHQHGAYDVTVDTSQMNVEQCVQAIQAVLSGIDEAVLAS